MVRPSVFSKIVKVLLVLFCLHFHGTGAAVAHLSNGKSESMSDASNCEAERNSANGEATSNSGQGSATSVNHEDPSSAHGLSGLNALFQAMEALKIHDNEVPYTEKNLELAVFLGDSAYELLRSKFRLSDDDIIELLLGYVDQVQAVFYQPSLKGKVHITVVNIELHKTRKFETFNGDRDLLLNSFCEYQSKLNSNNDSDPRHWDMALYLSALNFFSNDNGKVNFVSMGLAPVGGVCYLKDNCVIAEFGSVNELGHPYPSAGLMSSWVAAHEMGHNLGIFHDGQPMNDCPSNGYIMSSSRGTRGEINWSPCSAKMLSYANAECLQDEPAFPVYDHRKFNLRPGQRWDPHDQCKLFLRDEDAKVLNSSMYPTFCDKSILCMSPNKIGYFSSGPALEGTFCGDRNTCQHGQCLPSLSPLPVVEGGWSAWSVVSKCESKCLTNGLGSSLQRRFCNNPKPQNTVDHCRGEAVRVGLCDDTKQCAARPRMPVEEFSRQQCSSFSRYTNDLSFEGGMQIGHDSEKDWRACAIFCKINDGPWYTPRYELNDLQDVANPFFPDGTWCHHDERLGNFYCQLHRCVPAATARRRNGKFLSLTPPQREDPFFSVPLNITDPVVIAQIKEHYTFYGNDFAPGPMSTGGNNNLI